MIMDTARPPENPFADWLDVGYRFGVDGDRVILMQDGRRVRDGVTIIVEAHGTITANMRFELARRIAKFLNQSEPKETTHAD
jgi:hypothetical protein